MTTSSTAHSSVRFHTASRPARRPGLINLLLTWQERARSRQSLARLDADRLADIGLTQEQAYGEYAKPFWQR